MNIIKQGSVITPEMIRDLAKKMDGPFCSFHEGHSELVAFDQLGLEEEDLFFADFNCGRVRFVLIEDHEKGLRTNLDFLMAAQTDDFGASWYADLDAPKLGSFKQ